MKAAYIGTLTPGSTSLMRAERLKGLTSPAEWTWIDTDSVIISSTRLWRSAAYRLKTGAAVRRLNEAVIAQLGSSRFDMIWIDKGIFLHPATVRSVRKAAGRLVHFTPDTAFHTGGSRHFEKTVDLYDLLVTTKSFEVPQYIRRAGRDSVHLTTQGFDPGVHFPRGDEAQRRNEVAFVGLAEKDREDCIDKLLRAGITVRLSGLGWDRFVRRWKNNEHLIFEGTGLFGRDYANLLSRVWIGLGLLSKRFPELHTTRTFEIAACGAVLATEATSDTVRFFERDEALYFENYDDLTSKIKDLFSPGGSDRLQALAARGRQRVIRDERDYGSILRRVLSDPRLA